MTGRKYQACTDSYRYGFNGKENDNEVKGEGNQQDYGMRIYDPRLGRFLSVDPITKKYPELTPYQFASNRPIDGIDLDGKEFENYRSNQIIKNKGVAALPIIDYHHGRGPLVKGTYNEQLLSDEQSFQSLKEVYTTNPGIIHNIGNKYAQYDVLNQSKGKGTAQVGDNMHIEVTDPVLSIKLDVYVRFTDIQVTKNTFDITAATLYGHTDAGTINFSGSFDPNTKITSFSIQHETTTNFGIDPGVGRWAQDKQWKLVLDNVGNFLGGKVESKTKTSEVSIQNAEKGDAIHATTENLKTGASTETYKEKQ